jgi:hypothetical protein
VTRLKSHQLCFCNVFTAMRTQLQTCRRLAFPLEQPRKLRIRQTSARCTATFSINRFEAWPSRASATFETTEGRERGCAEGFFKASRAAASDHEGRMQQAQFHVLLTRSAR